MATLVDLVPPLCNGDILTADEFMRRWENEPTIKRAELIGGVVYMPSPVSIQHGELEGSVGTWLGYYRDFTPGTGAAHNATTFILDDVPQPDLHLRLLPEYGGTSWIEGNYLHGSPELLVEVCRSSAAYDLHQKLDLFEEAKVQEYVAVLLHEREIRWHRLVKGKYQKLSHDERGLVRSQVFPGLWLNAAALIAGQSNRVLTTLQEGLASAEHRAFVEILAVRANGET